MKSDLDKAGIARYALIAALLAAPLLSNAEFDLARWNSRAANPLAVLRQDNTSRLMSIASELNSKEAAHQKLLREAVLLCGFDVWADNREIKAESTQSPKLNLAITEGEIRSFSELYKRGDRVVLSNLVSSLDYAWKAGGFDGSTGPAINEFLAGGPTSKNESIRSLSIFIHALGAGHTDTEAHLPQAEAELDPIQVLLLLRVVTEDMAQPVVQRLKKEKPPAPAPDDSDVQQVAPPPGWAGDAWAGGYTGLYGQAVEHLSRVTGAEWLEQYGRRLQYSQAALSFAKFVMTYLFMKGDVTVEAPGAPLVRTKNRTAGEKRTLVAHFYIDGTKVTDWLKDNRAAIAAMGVDVDMPRTGDLAGVDTAWRPNDGGTGEPNDLIQALGVNLDRVKTDPAGLAKVVWEGVPQRIALDARRAYPVIKKVEIAITPQAKSNEAAQDMVDAVLGAAGVKGNPVLGLVGIIQEMMYRAKWLTKARYELDVKDWNTADVIGTLDLEFVGSGTTISDGNFLRYSVSRTCHVTDMEMRFVGVSLAQLVDVNSFPVSIRAQMEEHNAKLREMADKPTFIADGPGDVTYRIRDTWGSNSRDMECGGTGLPISKSVLSTGLLSKRFPAIDPLAPVPDAGGGYSIALHISANKAYLSFGGHKIRVTSSDGKSSDQLLLNSLTPSPPHTFSKFELPLGVTENPDMGLTNYYGSGLVQFTFGNNYVRNGIVSYSITMKRKTEP